MALCDLLHISYKIKQFGFQSLVESYMDFDALLAIVVKTLNQRRLSRIATAGTVAAAILTDKGNVYIGDCIDVLAGMGFCAEHSAIAAMITAGESKIVKLCSNWCR